FKLKLQGDPLRMEEVERVDIQAGRITSKLSVAGADGRVFTIGNLTHEKAEEVRALIEQRRAVYGEDPGRFAPSQTPDHPAGAEGIPQQIRELADLRDGGLLTEEEFAAKKRDLLDRM
ncbi:MAG: SHOCT domain-containing protein, partial [Rubrobacter sp.]